MMIVLLMSPSFDCNKTVKRTQVTTIVTCVWIIESPLIGIYRIKVVVLLERLELPTFCSEDKRSIQLSYRSGYVAIIMQKLLSHIVKFRRHYGCASSIRMQKNNEL